MGVVASHRGARLKVLADRLVAFTRMLVMAAGAATALSLAAIVSLQLGFWFMTWRWSPFPLSRLLELAGLGAERPYVLASDDGRPRSQDFGAWLLDLPAAVVLFVLVALLALAYTGLGSLERTRPGLSADGDKG
jgi:hypothetical protein